MEEIWKEIAECPKYEVSNYGRVRNKKTGRVLKNNACTFYPSVDLYYNGKHHQRSLHRLLMLAFVPNPDNLPVINHKDENPQNNFVWVNEDGSVDLGKSNLEWCSVKYNTNYGTGIERMRKKKEKPVKQMKKGTIIKIWKSQLEATKALAGQDNSGCIFSCLKGRTKTAYGFEWEYV